MQVKIKEYEVVIDRLWPGSQYFYLLQPDENSEL